MQLPLIENLINMPKIIFRKVYKRKKLVKKKNEECFYNEKKECSFKMLNCVKFTRKQFLQLKN